MRFVNISFAEPAAGARMFDYAGAAWYNVSEMKFRPSDAK